MKVEVGTYKYPDKVRWKGWIETKEYIIFEDLEGKQLVCKNPNRDD